jgi:transposase InsO family protein
MSVRRLVVEVKTEGLNVTRFCAEHGISTWFFWNLRKRFALEGEAALELKSRAPHRVANKTPPAMENAIVAKRKELLEAGLDAGSETIAFHLAHLEGVPSASTIYRILKDRGFVVAEPAKAPKRAGRSFTAARANECWQLDDTVWELSDTTPVRILNVIDDHSRLLVASNAMATCTGAAALAALAAAAVVLGWPARFLSDNATAFRYVLADALAALGITAGHSRPYHPQTCGKVERFHQTLKRWLARQPRAATLDELQTQLDCFRHLYNHQRPHRSLGRQFPASVWTHAPKSGPASHPLGAPTTTYRGVVTNGRLNTTRFVISLRATHNHKTAHAIITGENCHVFIDGQLVRQLTLDPTRRNQPIYDRPGARPQHERL